MKKDFDLIPGDLTPSEIDEILGSDVNLSDKSGISAANVKKSVFGKLGLSKPAPRFGIKRILAAAACLVLLAGCMTAVAACAAEAKEYSEAVEFFESYDLPSEGLSRNDIKAVYNDIVTNSFSNSKTPGVIANNYALNNIAGYKKAELISGPYVYHSAESSEDPFGFSIYINTENETFLYFECMISSFIGNGKYTVENGILKITDTRPTVEGSRQCVNLFRIEKNALVFIAEGSDNFMYVRIPDGAMFYTTFDSAPPSE